MPQCAARAAQAPTHKERRCRRVRSAREESFRTSLAPPHAHIAWRERFQAPPTVPQGAARAAQAPTQERGRRRVRSAREESFRASLAPPHAQIARRERLQGTVPQGAARAAQAPTHKERGRRRVRSAREESFRASLALHHAQIIAWRERFQDPRVPQDAPGAPMANFLPPIRLIAQLVPQENTHFPVPGPSLVNPHLMMTTAHAKYLLEQTESHKGSRRMVAMQTAVGLLMLRGAFISRFRSLSPSKIMTT